MKGLLEYMVRAPVALSRMRRAQGDTVVYAADRVPLRHGVDFRLVDPLDFIAAPVAHIPDPHKKRAIDNGWSSTKQRSVLMIRALPSQRPSAPDAALAPLSVRQAWAALINGVYELAHPQF